VPQFEIPISGGTKESNLTVLHALSGG